MNPQTLAEAQELFNKISEGIKNNKKVEVVICPPFTFIFNLKSANLNLKLGAQTCFWEENGAYTGEISPKMLKDLGCEYVIIGHSERRIILGETDEMINKKIKAAIKAGLKVILCIGETAEENMAGKTEEILKKQLNEGLKSIAGLNLLVAYEPVWAIGGGNLCNTQAAKKSRLFLKATLKEIPVLYGGSVDSECALSYIKESGFNGLLVGGASLVPKEFIEIIEKANG